MNDQQQNVHVKDAGHKKSANVIGNEHEQEQQQVQEPADVRQLSLGQQIAAQGKRWSEPQPNPSFREVVASVKSRAELYNTLSVRGKYWDHVIITILATSARITPALTTSLRS